LTVFARCRSRRIRASYWTTGRVEIGCPTPKPHIVPKTALERLIDAAGRRSMTAREIEAQRQSFAWGQQVDS
jgi:hypothetical protein